ncbi:hypothetical protein ABZZ79_00640 [Streptomyces sp. NPDC006458]|uniref:hypothetical protein n=1 Tax=Streptomyces sp. NPDC006458 TaxID=3154302 RepID=UPI0033A2F337
MRISPAPSRDDASRPLDDVPNPTTGGAAGAREPAYAHNAGPGPDAFEPTAGLRRGGDQPGSRLVPSRDAAWAGVLSVAVDAQQ